MKTKLITKKVHWQAVKNACRTTMNKAFTDKEVTDEFKIKLLLSEHSPICKLTVSWLWENMPSWVSVHFARHWLGWLKFISTSRSDRIGVDRNKLTQDTPVTYEGDANVQALINVARRRLCYQASPETREYMEDLKITIGNELDKHISSVMVPNCIYRGGCPEFMMCKELFYIRFLKYCRQHNIATNSIYERYKAYNQYITEEKLK